MTVFKENAAAIMLLPYLFCFLFR